MPCPLSLNHEQNNLILILGRNSRFYLNIRRIEFLKMLKVNIYLGMKGVMNFKQQPKGVESHYQNLSSQFRYDGLSM